MDLLWLVSSDTIGIWGVKSLDVLKNISIGLSSLFLLVCAFGGTQNLKLAYNHAVDLNYKFFSYGDAMLINRLDEK